MQQLRMKDNTQRRKEDFAPIPLLTEKIANKTLKQLEQEGVFIFPSCVAEAEDITEDQMVLQRINDCFRSGNVMGFLGYGKERLVLESRFSVSGQDAFLQYLLERVLDFPNVVNLDTDADQENKLFHLLLFFFPQYLKKAMRKGLYKTYICNRYNDSHVKGRLDIARHIKENTPFTGKIAYSQREYAYDNMLMELVRHTIEFIRKKAFGKNLLAKVKEEVRMVVDATPRYQPHEKRKVISENQQHRIQHAYYYEYRALQHLCLLILQHEKHQIGSGSRQIYGILFDGAWLWEEYIHTLIGDMFYHPKNKSRKGTQRLFAGNVGLIYPDFISKDRENRVIADAKYKPIENIGNQDYLQLLAYLFRFDAKQGYYLYPEEAEGENKTLWLNQGTTYEDNVEPRKDVMVVKCGLKIPANEENYEGFVRQIGLYEQEFCQVLFSIEPKPYTHMER